MTSRHKELLCVFARGVTSGVALVQFGPWVVVPLILVIALTALAQAYEIRDDW